MKYSISLFSFYNLTLILLCAVHNSYEQTVCVVSWCLHRFYCMYHVKYWNVGVSVYILYNIVVMKKLSLKKIDITYI